MIPAQAKFKIWSSRTCQSTQSSPCYAALASQLQSECALPGINPRKVSRMLIRTSLSQRSFSAKTPRGGRITARMILQISPIVTAMMLCLTEKVSRQRQPLFCSVVGGHEFDCHFGFCWRDIFFLAFKLGRGGELNSLQANALWPSRKIYDLTNELQPNNSGTISSAPRLLCNFATGQTRLHTR